MHLKLKSYQVFHNFDIQKGPNKTKTVKNSKNKHLKTEKPKTDLENRTRKNSQTETSKTGTEHRKPENRISQIENRTHRIRTPNQESQQKKTAPGIVDKRGIKG